MFCCCIVQKVLFSLQQLRFACPGVVISFKVPAGFPIVSVAFVFVFFVFLMYFCVCIPSMFCVFMSECIVSVAK